MEPTKGNYRGTVNMLIEMYEVDEVDEEYEDYIDTLSREELEEELIQTKAQLEALRDLEL